MVRDYTKWDDTPVSLQHFAESAVRAYKIAMTPPYEPVVLVADGSLQEEPITEKNLRIPKLVMSAPPQGDSGAVAEAAQAVGRRRKSGDRRRPRGPHAQGYRTPGRTGRSAASAACTISACA